MNRVRSIFARLLQLFSLASSSSKPLPITRLSVMRAALPVGNSL